MVVIEHPSRKAVNTSADDTSLAGLIDEGPVSLIDVQFAVGEAIEKEVGPAIVIHIAAVM